MVLKNFLNLVFISVLTFFVGCVADSTKKDEVASQPGIVNRLIANNVNASAFPSRSQSIITLDYTSIDNNLATSCSITSTNKVSVTQACSCDGLGVCAVGVTGVGAYSGIGGFNYNVSAGSQTSTTASASFIITAPPPGSNVPPVISSIGAKITTEGIAISSIGFSVSDSDSAVSCSNVTVASSNTTLIPNGNVVITGSGSSCYVSVTPATTQIGSSNITLTLTDTGTPLPAQTATSTFTVTVNAFNDAPTITSISSQVTNEDAPTAALAFTIGDVDSVVNCSSVTATSSNSALVSNSNVVIGGSGTSCTVTASPSLNQSGSTTITLSITDSGTPLPAKTATTSFSLYVAAVNDIPTISTIPTQATTENIAKIVNFTITDVDSNLDCSSSVSVTSSNTTLLPNTNISLSGIAPNCTATLTPQANQSGSTTLLVTVADNGFPMPIQTANTSFILMVNQLNHVPTISAITNQTTNEDTATSTIAFTIADSDSVIYCSNVIGTSNNTTLIPNANIVITGTAPNCTATITPAANGYGSASITLTLTDNGTPLPALTATSIFILTVNAINDVPTISSITTKTTNQGTSSAAILYTINDVDSSLSCATSVTASSSNTTLIPNANIVFSGTAPNCSIVVTPSSSYGSASITLTLTDNGNPLPVLTATTSFLMNVTQVNQAPTISSITNSSTNEDTATSAITFTIADSDSTIYCNSVSGSSSNTALVPNANIIITGTAPNCIATITPAANGFGTSVITLTVTDNGTPLPVMTASSVFTLTVNATNDTPTISAITNKTTTESTSSSAIAFTINDIDSTLTCAGAMSMTSSNTTLIPNANVIFAGTAPNCTAVVTPNASLSGTTTLTFMITDNGTPFPAATATSAFTMTVTAVNHAPTISAITNKITNEDTIISGIAFTIADPDAAVACSDVTGTSSDTSLVPNANIVIAGTSPNCTATITPAGNKNGTANITLTIADTGVPAPVMTANSVFNLSVSAVNDAPIISVITAKSADEDVASNAINFTITDIDSSLNCSANVVGTSSDTALIPNANIVIAGTAPNCNAVITSGLNKNGSATITLTLTDNGTPLPGLTVTSVFPMTINSVPDLSGTLSISNNLSGIASSYSGNSYGRVLKFPGLTSDEALTSVEICLGTTSGSCDIATWVEATGYGTSGSAPTVSLTGSYKLRSGVGGAQTFSLSPTCGAANNYYYSVRATNAGARTSNILSTPAWTFWEPTCLGSLAQWLDASESATVTISSGTSVGSWADRSGNGMSVTGLATKQPTYTATAMGAGLPGMIFNGTSQVFYRNAFVYNLGATSIFTVIKAAAIATSRGVFSEGGAAATNVSYAPLMTSASVASTLTGSIYNNAGTLDLNLPATSTTLFNGNIKLGMVEDTGSTFYTYSNGLAQSQGIYNYTRNLSSPTIFRLGARFRNNADTVWMNGSIGEFIVTNGVLSTLNRQKLEGYSAHKWGVSANLPAGHPYLTTPP